MLWLCYKLPSGLFGNTRDTSVMHEKAKSVCFDYMHPQKVKFKYVQINMKHVLYSTDTAILIILLLFHAIMNRHTKVVRKDTNID